MLKKSINIWSFSPEKSLEDCFRLAKAAGFEGIEPALSKNGPISLSSTKSELQQIRALADRIGIKIHSLATGLYWQYSLTSNIPENREKAKEIVRRQIDVASALGADCVLVCPGTVGVDFRPEDVVPDAEQTDFFAGSEVIDYEIAYDRSVSAFRELAPYAQEKGVLIGVENIWNKFLLSPLEFRAFIEAIQSPAVGVFLDVGNVLQYGYPEHWIRILGNHIKKVHFKDYRRDARGLAGFVDLLAGDVNWPRVMDAFDAIGYTGWASAEMCPTYRYYTDQMIYNTSCAMDCILQRKQHGSLTVPMP